ncbi:hypothetical protein FRB99_000488 [Tulasnella sp. 403]|nr:hypothetical protein FRB99_000488 [Tulasnella sp. 403]
MPGLISGRLFDIGYLHTPLLVASIVLVLCTILTAECTTYVHFLVTQGIITGLASAFVFGPAMPIISHWFKKRRSSGIGVAIAGASFGGTILPIIVRQLIPVVGRKWTMRIVGLILFVFLGAANLLIRRRLPPVRVRGGLINPAAFKQASYSIYCLGTFIGFLGLYTPLTFLDVSAIESAHLSPGFSFYLISIANASSTIGRVGGGFLSDKLGCLNVLIPSDIVAAAITFAWPYCATKVGLINVAVFFGIAFGTSVGLFTAPIAHLGDPSDIGRRTGMLYTLVSISSLIGPPISGAIFSKSGGFQGVGIYAATPTESRLRPRMKFDDIAYVRPGLQKVIKDYPVKQQQQGEWLETIAQVDYTYAEILEIEQVNTYLTGFTKLGAKLLEGKGQSIGVDWNKEYSGMVRTITAARIIADCHYATFDDDERRVLNVWIREIQEIFRRAATSPPKAAPDQSVTSKKGWLWRMLDEKGF